MSQELLYTSAPRGLKPGSRGFCTVVNTQGMPAVLATILESLSAYRHVYSSGDPRSANNPVVWSHMKLQAAGKTYSVLSRVGDYGLDYSGRANKLAHHVALEAREQSAGGPAWQLSQPGFMQTDWDGEPRLRPSGRSIHSGAPSHAVCTAWQATTGDAGWAAVLAESFLASPDGQAYITFEPGMDLLPLLVEAIALLPLERRWDVTFSTFFTNLPPGVTCNWRCVLTDSTEANQSRRFVHALRINLCEALPPAVGGALVEAARTGRPAFGASPAPRAPPEANPELSDDELVEELELAPIEETLLPRAAPTGIVFAGLPPIPESGAFEVHSPPPLPPGMPPPPPAKSRRKLDELYAEEARRKRRWLPVKIAVGALLLFIGLAVGAWLGLGRPLSIEDFVARRRPEQAQPEGDRPADDQIASAASRSEPADHGESVASARGRNREDAIKEGDGASDRQEEKAAAEGPAVKRDSEPPEPTTAAELPPPRPSPPTEPDDKKAHDPMPVIDDRAPTYDGGEVVKVESAPTEFQLYRLNAMGDKTIRVPIQKGEDVDGVKWELHLPKGLKFGVDNKPEKSTWRLLRSDQNNKFTEPVFVIEGAVESDQLTLKLRENDSECKAIRWCALTIRDRVGVRLISLQDARLDWHEPRLKGFLTSQPLPNCADELSVPDVQVKSATIDSPLLEKQFQFGGPYRPKGSNDSWLLSCTELDDVVMTWMASKTTFEFPLQFKRAGRNVEFQFPKKKLDDAFKQQIERHVDAIVALTGLPRPERTKKRKSIINGLVAKKPTELSKVRDELAQSLNKLKTSETGSPNPNAAVLESDLGRIDELLKFADKYFQSMDDLGGAKINETILNYEMEIPESWIRTPVHFDLRFSRQQN